MNRRKSILCIGFLLFAFLAAAVPRESSAVEYLVSDRVTNQVFRFSADDGTFLGILIDDNSATNGGLFLPSSMTIGFDGDLFVTSTGNGLVLRYDAFTGSFLEVFASGLYGPASLLYHEPSATLLVGQLGNLGDTDVIARYDADGTRLTDLQAGPVSGRTGMITTSNGDLLVGSFADEMFMGAILEFDFDAETNAFDYAGILNQSPELSGVNGIAMDAEGDLYVANLFRQSVQKIDMEDGAAVGSTVFAQLPYPSDVLISNEGQVLVTGLGNDNPADEIWGPNVFPGSVMRYDPADGSGEPFLVGGEEFQPTAIIVRPEPGDYNGDGLLTAYDIDELTRAVRDGSTAAKYDLNRDDQVDSSDREHWVEQLKNTYFGDADLNGEFNTGDFVAVLTEGQYEDGVLDNSTWASGDWNGDGEFGTGDLVLALEKGGYEMGPRETVAAVPEPSAVVLLWSALIGLGYQLRRRVNRIAHIA